MTRRLDPPIDLAVQVQLADGVRVEYDDTALGQDANRTAPILGRD